MKPHFNYRITTKCKIAAVALLGTMVYLLMSYNSVGFYHPDEHFQILEFANYKLGKINYGQLPWEYPERLRSTIQPWIALLVIKAAYLLHVFSPYTITFILRLMTAMLSLYAISRMAKVLYADVSPAFRWLFLYLSYFLWFLPFINVRFSSETFCSIFFLLAVVHVMRAEKLDLKSCGIAGILCGISFLCRFQAGFMVLGLLLWLTFIKKQPFRVLLTIAAFCLLVTVTGILIDSLFYGSFTISAVNYFRENITNDRASLFGVVSWYKYLLLIIGTLYFPAGIAVLLSVLVFIARYPRSLITWGILPLIIIHFVVPHKEVRFLFPVVNFLPFIMVKGLFEPLFGSISKVPAVNRKVAGFVTILIIVVNSLALAVSLYTPPLNGRMRITRYIYDHFSNKPVTLYSGKWSNPFRPYVDLRQSFYEIPAVHYHHLDNYAQTDTLGRKTGVQLLVLRRANLDEPAITRGIQHAHLQLLCTGKPAWCRYMLEKLFNTRDEDEYMLFRIR